MIDVHGLRFAYPGSRNETIKGIDFSIGRGEIFGFLGPSGAGKSTLQKILIGILKGFRGDVNVMAYTLDHIHSDYYERIGVAFETPNFYDKFTALENLSFFGSLYSGETRDPRAMLPVVGLEDHAHMKVSNFSKGMKMRLNLCRAFLHEPEVIFLDEPTAGLDPVNAQRVKAFLVDKKAEGKTILLTTHNMNVAEEICDRVAFIVDGGIPLIDSPRQLKIDRGNKNIRVEYREKGQSMTAEFPLQGAGRNRDFLRVLTEKEVETVHTQEATLEDIFIEVTGRGLS